MDEFFERILRADLESPATGIGAVPAGQTGSGANGPQLWQMVLSRRDRRAVYRSVRPFGVSPD